MPKHYVIPIDADNYAYLGVKSSRNPYSGNQWFCGGAPNPFGGNLQGTVENTLYYEAREESHMKIDIQQDNLRVGALGTANINCPQVHHSPNHGGMTFYALRENFRYSPGPYFPDILARMPKYQETTGKVIKFDLTSIDLTDPSNNNRGAVADAVMNKARQQYGIDIPGQGVIEFRGSETAEAIRQAALAVQAGRI